MTVLELLVVIAIIGVLLGLLVPAVQKARQAAARIACANNLKQLGLALQGFHAVKGGFPAAQTSLPNQKKKVGIGWVPFILPYIEQEALFHEYDFKARWDEPSNAVAVTRRIPLLLCASAPGERVGLAKRGVGDYAPTCTLISSPFMASPPPKDKTFVGVLGKNVNRKITEITDGASNTLLLAEDAGFPAEWTMGKMTEVKFGTTAWASANNILRIGGFNPATGTTPGPCAVNCYNKHEIYSFHPGGANVLFADGATRFLGAAADINVVSALVTRRGGETSPADTYAP
jgi:prepilin-type processing-associated H-X9-DG protein